MTHRLPECAHSEEKKM